MSAAEVTAAFRSAGLQACQRPPGSSPPQRGGRVGDPGEGLRYFTFRSAPFSLTFITMLTAFLIGCRAVPASKPTARNLLLITVDTLRADHVGAYGYAKARTPTLDGLARGGVVFDRAYAASPVTLPSHATLVTGRYPPGHGSRDNGLRVSSDVPTLATVLHARGVKTAAFVAAFPLDRQFGLNRGFDVYGDQIPRGPGRPRRKRAARLACRGRSDRVAATVARCLAAHLPHLPYLPSFCGSTSSSHTRRTAIRPRAGRLWIGTTTRSRTVDREIGRLIGALGTARTTR